jgi:tetratricopeptide (TPR) repeat protein
MQRPLIFLSAVSLELGSARRLAAATLHQMGYDTVLEDSFPTGHGELRQWLREQITRCDGLLQLVGDACGAEPPEVNPEYGRVSYTQFELIFARKQGKKIWVVEAQPGYPCDTAPDQLDLPRDPHHPDPAGYQAERRGLQRAYRQRLRAENQLRHAANSELKLQLILKDLKDDLAEVRRRSERSWRRLNLAIVGILAVLALLGGGGWWAYQRLHREVVTSDQVDATRIRAHLVEAADGARARELAEADVLTGWQERQRRREAAEAAHQARLGRVDELTTFLAQLEGRADASDISRELNRILAEEGVDQALAFLDQQRPGILERARARLSATRERNRADLEPLLTAARLENQRGQPVRAREQFTQILELEPDWPVALATFAWFLYDQAFQQKTHGSLSAAVADATKMLSLAERLPPAERLSYDDSRALPAALGQMADVLDLRRQAGDAEQALEYYNRGLKFQEGLLQANPESAGAARDVSVSLEKLANLLTRRGQAGDIKQALGYCNRSLEIRERLHKANPESAEAARDVAGSLDRLADLLTRRGQAGDIKQALGYCNRSLEMSERLLQSNPESAEAARDVAGSLDRLADLLTRRGQAGDAEQALGYSNRSLEMSERLLQSNPESAQAARDVAASLDRLADLLTRRGQPGDAEQALGYSNRSLEMSERQLQANPESAQAARDVALSLERLAHLLTSRGHAGDAEQAWAHSQRSLEIHERLLQANPESAQAARDVAASHFKFYQLHQQRGDEQAAQASLAKCIAILDDFAAQGRPVDAQMSKMYSELQALFKKP